MSLLSTRENYSAHRSRHPYAVHIDGHLARLNQIIDCKSWIHFSTGTINKNINLGKVNNQNFINIGINQLRQKLFDKCNAFGINFIEQEESYTSGCSALDLEPITKKSYDKSRRIVRGLFASSYGIINSDVNGSLNILRKSEKCIPDLIKLKRDNGKLDSPKRIRVAC